MVTKQAQFCRVYLEYWLGSVNILIFYVDTVIIDVNHFMGNKLNSF